MNVKFTPEETEISTTSSNHTQTEFKCHCKDKCAVCKCRLITEQCKNEEPAPHQKETGFTLVELLVD